MGINGHLNITSERGRHQAKRSHWKSIFAVLSRFAPRMPGGGT